MKVRSVNEPVESKGHRSRNSRDASKEKGDPLGLVEMAMRKGDHAQALTTIDRLLAEEPDHLGALELKARCQWQVGEHQALTATLRRLIALNPYEPGYHALLGSALQCLGRYGEAAQSLERAAGTPGQEETLSDLRAWQAGLVAEMLQDDPIFRAHYRQDPRAACASRGFHVATTVDRPLVFGRTERAALYTRPS
ncbi:MAG: tetratricopeptide repeat protein [Fimbriimonas sp.]